MGLWKSIERGVKKARKKTTEQTTDKWIAPEHKDAVEAIAATAATGGLAGPLAGTLGSMGMGAGMASALAPSLVGMGTQMGLGASPGQALKGAIPGLVMGPLGGVGGAIGQSVNNPLVAKALQQGAQGAMAAGLQGGNVGQGFLGGAGQGLVSGALPGRTAQPLLPGAGPMADPRGGLGGLFEGIDPTQAAIQGGLGYLLNQETGLAAGLGQQLNINTGNPMVDQAIQGYLKNKQLGVGTGMGGAMGGVAGGLAEEYLPEGTPDWLRNAIGGGIQGASMGIDPLTGAMMGGVGGGEDAITMAAIAQDQFGRGQGAGGTGAGMAEPTTGGPGQVPGYPYTPFPSYQTGESMMDKLMTAADYREGKLREQTLSDIQNQMARRGIRTSGIHQQSLGEAASDISEAATAGRYGQALNVFGALEGARGLDAQYDINRRQIEAGLAGQASAAQAQKQAAKQQAMGDIFGFLGQNVLLPVMQDKWNLGQPQALPQPTYEPTYNIPGTTTFDPADYQLGQQSGYVPVGDGYGGWNPNDLRMY